jgi:hypothetical protein
VKAAIQSIESERDETIQRGENMTRYPRSTVSPESLPRDDRLPRSNRGSACHEATEDGTEKAEPDPRMIQSVVEHQEVPKEDSIVKPVKGRKKRRRGRKPAAGR